MVRLSIGLKNWTCSVLWFDRVGNSGLRFKAKNKKRAYNVTSWNCGDLIVVVWCSLFFKPANYIEKYCALIYFLSLAVKDNVRWTSYNLWNNNWFYWWNNFSARLFIWEYEMITILQKKEWTRSIS